MNEIIDNEGHNNSTGGFRPIGKRVTTLLYRQRPGGDEDYRVFNDEDGFVCFVRNEALRDMGQWAQEKRGTEKIGRLWERQCEDSKGEYVLVEKATLNRYADSYAAAVVADNEAQAAALAEFERECRPLCCVGWWHSHPPGCGAFYSSVDRDNQRTWNHANAIGIVLDPSSPEDGLRVFRGPESAELEQAHEAGELLDSAMVPVIRRKRGEWQQVQTEGILGDDARSTVTAGSDSQNLRFWRTVGFAAVISLAFTSLLVSLMTHIVVLSWAEPRSLDSVPRQEFSDPPDTKAQRPEIKKAEKTKPNEESRDHSDPKLDDPDSRGRVR